MKKTLPYYKNVSDLTIDDFLSYPIWSWMENDDESLVEPIEYLDALSDDHDALFVLCEFLLHDGTKVSGKVSVRMSDGFVYLLSFPDRTGKFFDLTLQPILKNPKNREQLATLLNKSQEDIFPITYTTRFFFNDRRLLAGKIE